MVSIYNDQQIIGYRVLVTATQVQLSALRIHTFENALV